MIIKTRVTGCKLADIDSFRPFQGDLKTIDIEVLNKLKTNILKNGFISPVFSWQGNIIDGTHRIIALKELLTEGHKLDLENQIPFVEIEANDRKQAAEYVLSYNSQFGKITKSGLLNFSKNMGLDLRELNSTINLDIKLDVDFGKKKAEEKKLFQKKCPKCGFEY